MLLERLAKSGKSENTLVIYIGDHGAQFSRGKATCYEGGLRIPFIVRWPGTVRAGLVRENLVSTIDILPTILDAVGVDNMRSLPGMSLLPLARGEDVKLAGIRIRRANSVLSLDILPAANRAGRSLQTDREPSFRPC